MNFFFQTEVSLILNEFIKDLSTNLLNFAAKSDFNIQTVQDRGLKMSNDFKTLLKRKNSEKLRSNTPMIFISKPEEIYDENSNNYF